MLDIVPGSIRHAGCEALLDAVTRIKPRLHAFGHVHGALGVLRAEYTTFVNAALLGLGGALDQDPIAPRMVKS